MTRLIDADELRELYNEHIFDTYSDYNFVIDTLDYMPTIDAEPVRHGKWRFVNCATGLRCQCSECLHWVDAGADKNYCPECGARMDERKEG